MGFFKRVCRRVGEGFWLLCVGDLEGMGVFCEEFTSLVRDFCGSGFCRIYSRVCKIIGRKGRGVA